LISVITPTYNGERFIEYCIRNVIEQRCPNLEHVIVDGGSTDNTVDIIKRYASVYPHIRWVSEKDSGQSDAMNKGVAMARGDVLGFLNVDDYYNPGVLNCVAELFPTLSEPHLLVGNCRVFDDNDDLLFVNKPAKLSLLRLLMASNVNPLPVNPSAYFYHASLHQKIGLYSTSEHYVLDFDFLLRAVQMAAVTYINQDWGNMRLIRGTKTHTDMQNGTSGPRVEKLLTDYRNRLPLRQRLTVNLGHELYTNQAVRWRILRIACFVEGFDLQLFLKRKFSLLFRRGTS